MATRQPLQGIRVLDFSSGPVGGLATTVLADFGADVVKVEPPRGDRLRSLASSPFWLRGKRSVVLDLKDAGQRERAQDLAGSADVVVISGPSDRGAQLGLDAGTLTARHPSLVHCSITPWGPQGPYTSLPGYEGVVAAKAGRMAAFELQLGRGPVYPAVQVATHVASQAAVQGISAALFRRELSGQGGRVETSLLQSLMPFDLLDALTLQLASQQGGKFVSLRAASAMPTLNYHPVRTQDGRWIQNGNLLEHLFYSFLDATDLLGELLAEEEFQGSPATWAPESIERARDRILLRIQERTAEEWMKIFRDNGNVAAEIVLTSQEALRHPDLVEGGGLVELDDPEVGRVTQLAPIAELTETPARVTRPAPRVGEHSDEVLSESRAEPSLSRSGPAAPGRPLDGITILDLSTIIAGPLGISMLADLGARVIKIEPYEGDPYRHLVEAGVMAVKTNAGKDSISINLKTPEGQALLHELVATADVIAHNFRAGVPERLGLGYEEVKAIRPDIIWAVVNGYGPHGPSAKRPATHPVIGAATGGVAYQAGPVLSRECESIADLREAARQIMSANEANPDPNTSVVAASSIAMALLERARTGTGQQVFINMQMANAWANAADFLDYSGKPERAQVDAELHGLGATYRLYPTREGWVFLALVTDEEFARFCKAAECPELASDARFSSVEERRQNDDALAQALLQLFALDDATSWEKRLAPVGIGCVRADDIEAGAVWNEDPQVLANGWAPAVQHARFGSLRRWGPLVTVDGLNPDYRSGPLQGEHTDKVLSELGKSDGEIQQLRDAKIVTSEPV